MKYKYKFGIHFFTFTVLFFIATRVRAQVSAEPIVSMEIISTPIGDTITNGLPDYSDSTEFLFQMIIITSDTTNIDEFRVSLGDSTGRNNLMSNNFTFDGLVSQPFDYSRTNYTVTLGLGKYRGITSFYGEAYIKRTNGSFSSSVVFSRVR